ncbi:aldo/keto reductase [Klebsiella pneumoniae]|nr:aldo/keto reductase [Klebsiella pneumoniae]
MLVTMTDKELYRLGIIQRVFDRALLQRDAADILKLSVRQVQRLVRLYRTDGATAFASSRRGRPANNRIDEETRCKALDLIRCHYSDFGPTTRFITMQPQYNLLYREEEREMLPLCEDQGVGVIPWSPMARGRLTRDWSVTSRRTQNDAFALKMYENAALLDKPVIDVVASIAEKHAVPRAHVAIAWLLSKTVITAPIIGATKPEHLSTAISALDFSLSDAEIIELEAQYLPHPVDGIIPPLPDTPPSLTPPSAIQNC